MLAKTTGHLKKCLTSCIGLVLTFQGGGINGEKDQVRNIPEFNILISNSGKLIIFFLFQYYNNTGVSNFLNQFLLWK